MFKSQNKKSGNCNGTKGNDEREALAGNSKEAYYFNMIENLKKELKFLRESRMRDERMQPSFPNVKPFEELDKRGEIDLLALIGIFNFFSGQKIKTIA